MKYEGQIDLISQMLYRYGINIIMISLTFSILLYPQSTKVLIF